MNKSKTNIRVEASSVACRKELVPPVARRNILKKDSNFITNDRLTTAFTSIKNMFSRKVESRSLQSKRKHGSKKKLFAGPVNDRDDSEDKSSTPSSRRGLIRKKSSDKVKNRVEGNVPASSSTDKVRRFLSDLRNQVQSPVISSRIDTPACRIPEKISSNRCEVFSKNLWEKENETTRGKESPVLSADSKKFYQEVFAKDMIETLVGVMPRFCKKDIVVSVKKKLRESYLAHEDERKEYLELKMAEEAQSQVISTPSEYKDYQSQSSQEMAIDPYDFLAHFNPEPQELSLAEATEPLTPMSFIQQQCKVTESRPFCDTTAKDVCVGDFSRLQDGRCVRFAGFGDPTVEIEKLRSGGPSSFEVTDGRINLAFSTDANKGILPFALKEPEFKYYRRMLY